MANKMNSNDDQNVGDKEQKTDDFGECVQVVPLLVYKVCLISMPRHICHRHNMELLLISSL